MPLEPDRRVQSRRSADVELERWRGQIDERVDGHERRLTSVNGDLRDLRTELRVHSEAVILLRSEVREARADIGEAVKDITSSRNMEHADLRAAIVDSKTKNWDMIKYVAAPILVALVLALMLFAATGHLR